MFHNQACNMKMKNNNDEMMDNNNKTNNSSTNSKHSSLQTRMFQNNRHSYFESSSSRIIINQHHKIEISLKILPSKYDHYAIQLSHATHNEMRMTTQTRVLRIPIK